MTAVGRHRVDNTALRRRGWLRVAGAALLAGSASIHLYLFLTGYRSIPIIGWLFMLQVIVGFVLAAGSLVTFSRVAAAAGAAFALSTLGCYLLAVWIGLFGFREVRTRAGIAAGLIEVAAFATLAMVAFIPDAAHQAGRRTRPGTRIPATVTLKTAKIGGTTVLTNAHGLTLYLFVPDTPTTSKCTGLCATYWPPVTGSPKAGPGVTGKLGTITRPGGGVQATYDGHPLYTYIGDSSPGQEQGDNLDLNGGLWYVVPVSG